MINFFASINNLGYGIHAYNFMRSLDNLGIELILFPINNKVDYLDTYIEKWLKNQRYFNKKDISIMLFHASEMNKFSGSVRIGYPVFETGITDRDNIILSTLDYIFQPSIWGKNYLESRNHTNVFVIPEGYNPNIYNITNFNFAQKQKMLDEQGIIFSHIGKFEKRKSSTDIITVFTQSLNGINNRCTLIAHMYNPFLADWYLQIRTYILNLNYNIIKEDLYSTTFSNNNLKIIVPKCKFKNIQDIYKESHFGIYLSKAEGWNLPLIESIAQGLPCITTKHTGQTDYLQLYPKELIVNNNEKVLAQDNVWFFGNVGHWTEPDLGSAKEILINIGKNPMKFLNLYKDCFNSVKDFTWDNASKICVTTLKKLNLL